MSYFIQRSSSLSLDKEQRSDKFRLLELHCEVSTFSDVWHNWSAHSVLSSPKSDQPFIRKLQSPSCFPMTSFSSRIYNLQILPKDQYLLYWWCWQCSIAKKNHIWTFNWNWINLLRRIVFSWYAKWCKSFKHHHFLRSLHSNSQNQRNIQTFFGLSRFPV